VTCRSCQGSECYYKDAGGHRNLTWYPAPLQEKVTVQLAQPGRDHAHEQAAHPGDEAATMVAMADLVMDLLALSGDQAGLSLVAPILFLDVKIHPDDVDAGGRR